MLALPRVMRTMPGVCRDDSLSAQRNDGPSQLPILKEVHLPSIQAARSYVHMQSWGPRCDVVKVSGQSI